MKYANDDTDRTLHGQADRRRAEATGYAMAVLLVGIAVMSILLSAAMPVWRQAVRREQEAELVFRGEQYARAIGLYQRKFAGAFPPNLDVLVEQKYLRRKYKDPITKDGEFQVLYQATSQTPGAAGQSAGPGQSAATAGRGAGLAARPSQAAPPGARGAVGAQGGVVGVVSKSKEKSIRLYKGRQYYNEWQFIYVAVTTQPGGVPGAARPGMAPDGPGRLTPAPGQPRPGMPGRPDEPIRPGPRGSGRITQPGRPVP